MGDWLFDCFLTTLPCVVEVPQNTKGPTNQQRFVSQKGYEESIIALFRSRAVADAVPEATQSVHTSQRRCSLWVNVVRKQVHGGDELRERLEGVLMRTEGPLEVGVT